MLLGMAPTASRDQPQFPIRTVAERTGLSPDVLRAWERRYGVIAPGRSEAGQRLYSDADISRLQLLVQAIRAGHTVGRVATLPLDQLRALIERDTPRPGAIPVLAREYQERAYAAVVSIDPDGLHATLRTALLALGTSVFLDELIAPLLHQVGTAWHAGKIQVAHEHAASAVIRSVLTWVIDSLDTLPQSPRALIACLPTEQHELGAMLAAVAAAQSGWRAIFLGANVPTDDIIATARSRDVAAVAISVIRPEEPEKVCAELSVVRRRLPASCSLIAGGSGVAALGTLAVGIQTIRDLTEFRLLLASLAA